MLTVLLGSGGASAVLARSLTVWLQTRRSDVKITVSTPDGNSVTVEATNLRPEEALPAITRVLDRDDA
ncbi:hypothetical protein WN71_008435 [Streptomyces mangrovisoli]|uniref:Uncharacterized protein n=1 Tax=Streptomyces mangrovisoli TaxID=1428628 RepID=A0A1J4P3V5_9ACTN|nr:hypothetical protein WN71_008435 [Streptomyces mangrovisoli]